MKRLEDRIKVSAVSYVNSYPFIHGLRNHSVSECIELNLDTPAECAQKLLDGSADIGLVPVAIIPSLQNAHIITDSCIGAFGKVESVCLFSDVPLGEIEEVILDYQSKTSVQLVQVLADEKWSISPRWVNAKEGFIDQIGGTTAGVVIGDRAFELRKRYPVIFDLSEEWKSLTGLPFVFACWVSVKPLSESFIKQFSEALWWGLKHRDEAIDKMVESNRTEMKRYVHEVISYNLDDKKLEAMKLFHRLIGNAISTS